MTPQEFLKRIGQAEPVEKHMSKVYFRAKNTGTEYEFGYIGCSDVFHCEPVDATMYGYKNSDPTYTAYWFLRRFKNVPYDDIFTEPTKLPQT